MDEVAAPPLLSERQDSIAILTFNRPAVLNALNGVTWAALEAALGQLADDRSVRVVILTGAGERAFSAGADMREVADDDSAEATRARSALSARATERLIELPQPVIAAVNGYAYGGGAILATMCDIRIASANARLRFPGVAYGLVAATPYLARAVGLPKAMELALTARPIEASEAAAIGLVNQVVPVGQALATALSMAAQIAANEAAAVSATKQLLRLSLSGDLASARQRESAANAAYLGSTEHRRVFADFVRTTLDRPNS